MIDAQRSHQIGDVVVTRVTETHIDFSRCLGQVAAIAGMQAQEKGLIAHYHPWQLEAYATPPALPTLSA